MSEIHFTKFDTLADFAIDAIAEHATGIAISYRDKAWDSFDEEWECLQGARRLALGEGISEETIKDVEAAAMTSIEL